MNIELALPKQAWGMKLEYGKTPHLRRGLYQRMLPHMSLTRENLRIADTQWVDQIDTRSLVVDGIIGRCGKRCDSLNGVRVKGLLLLVLSLPLVRLDDWEDFRLFHAWTSR